MMIKRILSTAAAFAAALSFSLTAVSADSVKFTADESKLSAKDEPTISFDGEKFMDYIHLTRDAEKANISFEQDKDTYYQGASMSVSANTSGVKGYMTYSCMVRDDDNNLLYPDAPDPKEDTSSEYSVIGIELQSADFGLSCFDGCLFTFAYRLTTDDESALLGDSVWVFPSDDDYRGLASNPIKLTVDTSYDNNVTQYRKGVVSVPADTGATKLIFEIPTIGAVKGDVLYLDNIQISLPDGYEDTPYVANVDSYNSAAQPREIIEELQITQNNTADVEAAEETVKKTSDKTNPVIVIVIVVVVAGLGVGAFFVIKKMRNRFY